VKTFTVPINQIKDYSLPVFMTTADLDVDHFTKLPTFAKFTFPTYNFSPKTKVDLGRFYIKGKLFNKYGSLDFFFIVEVTSPEITLNNGTPKNLEVDLGSELKTISLGEVSGSKVNIKTYE
jgi:hypothetical protein